MLTIVWASLVIISAFVITLLVKEWLRRKNEGFYIRTRGNADGGDLMYHEPGRSLTFYFDRVARIIYVPSDREWEEKMPEWARARKIDIVERIRKRVGEKWAVEEKAK